MRTYFDPMHALQHHCVALTGALELPCAFVDAVMQGCPGPRRFGWITASRGPLQQKHQGTSAKSEFPVVFSISISCRQDLKDARKLLLVAPLGTLPFHYVSTTRSWHSQGEHKTTSSAIQRGGRHRKDGTELAFCRTA